MPTDINSYEATTDPDGTVKVSYSLGQPPFVFSDALVFRDGDLSQAEIDAEIQRRYDEWLIFVTTPRDPDSEEQ